ncbi:hypothetical protein POF50_019615 [Streptomyces sp. SL13]|uniref:Uncharacterized protein n=1 Tax=Streptantibioticus silvisoli TaxID=2705255 RepID=A0AA90H9R8_9ACTN|nr:hypothetical protein [Streptantibioticus silvisoli]MDI5971510.1 hypothetical protein [Streptantibioticus silvisoli]
MPRLRIRYVTWPRPGLILTDTPDPNCPGCHGDGGWSRDYGDYDTGEYAGTDWDPCNCWNEDRRWPLLPLPRRKTGTAYSDEPPF